VRKTDSPFTLQEQVEDLRKQIGFNADTGVPDTNNELVGPISGTAPFLIRNAAPIASIE
jgi:hypothetical protein